MHVLARFTTTLLVAIGYGVEAWTFTVGATGWVGLKTNPGIAMPKSARELVALVCR